MDAAPFNYDAMAQQAGGYSPEQFNQWYQGQFGQAPNSTLMGEIGTAVGAPGANGLYTANQWQTGQQMAQERGKGGTFFPEFQAPTFEAGPAYQAPEPFKAPTMEQAQADPGYQFSLQQGQKALETSAAARGIARTGGALKDLLAYGQDRGAQQYENVYNREAQNYQQNYQMGRDAWAANQQQREGAFDRNYRGASDAFNAKFRGKELTFADLFNRWNVNTNTQTQLALAD